MSEVERFEVVAGKGRPGTCVLAEIFILTPILLMTSLHLKDIAPGIGSTVQDISGTKLTPLDSEVKLRALNSPAGDLKTRHGTRKSNDQGYRIIRTKAKIRKHSAQKYRTHEYNGIRSGNVVSGNRLRS